ncbi:MAG: PHP domain-containing protein, partial [Acidimicrobiales bacterium]
MDPVDALEQIAYLLETRRAETYKVRAFRNAADVIREINPSELTKLARSNRLSSLSGVGKTTAAVIEQALRGEEPAYLVELGSEVAPPLSGPVAELRKKLKGDCHGHSDWSDGGSPVQTMAEAARDLGHEYWTLTDHSARLTVAHGLDSERLLSQLDLIEELNETLAPFRILTGMEVDILEDGSLDLEEELLARLDVVVGSVHSKLRMDSDNMTKRMLRAIENPNIDILGHCTGRIVVGKGRPESTFDHEAIIEACARTETAVEINSRPERLDPPIEILRLAVANDCFISIDTDAHAPGQLEWQSNGCEMAVASEVDPKLVVNSW